MKFLRISGVHYAAPQQIPYRNNPILHDLPYESQLKECFSYAYNYGDSLTHHLKAFGYDAAELIYDLEPLQKKWAEEHGVSYSKENWQAEILIHQIQKLKPEILYLHNAFSLPYQLFEKRKQLFPFLRTLIMFRGYPEINRTLFRFLSAADLLLVGSPVLKRICKEKGLTPHLFYHYFDERLLSRINLKECINEHAFTFLGSTGFGYGWNHQPRYHYLYELLKATEIKCWIDENSCWQAPWKESIKRKMEWIMSPLPRSYLSRLNDNCSIPSSFRKIAFNTLARKLSRKKREISFPDRPLRRLFSSQCCDSLFGIEMYQTLAASKVTFNKHTVAAMETADNIRLFEATGVSTCLLTDQASNLSEIFEVDREVVVYSSVEECIEKLNFLLKDEAARKEIAIRGHQRTLRDHSASKRAKQLHELIKNLWD